MNPDVITAHAQVTSLLSRLYRMVSREDISQEAWLALLDSEWGPDGPQMPTEPDTDTDVWDTYNATIKALKKAMRSGAEKYCRKEKAALEGYRIEDEQFYSIGSLRVLLECWFSAGVTESPPKSYEHSISRPTRTAGQGDYLVSLLDVGAGLARLNDDQAAVLVAAYGPAYAGCTDEEIAAELRDWGWLDMTAEKFAGRVRTALGRLQRELGGPMP